MIIHPCPIKNLKYKPTNPQPRPPNPLKNPKNNPKPKPPPQNFPQPPPKRLPPWQPNPLLRPLLPKPLPQPRPLARPCPLSPPLSPLLKSPLLSLRILPLFPKSHPLRLLLQGLWLRRLLHKLLDRRGSRRVFRFLWTKRFKRFLCMFRLFNKFIRFKGRCKRKHRQRENWTRRLSIKRLLLWHLQKQNNLTKGHL